MDQYLPISILTTRADANKACETLEDAGIPIMLQFVQVEEGAEKMIAYRLFVPLEFRQASFALLGIAATVATTTEESADEADAEAA